MPEKLRPSGGTQGSCSVFSALHLEYALLSEAEVLATTSHASGFGLAMGWV
jgi:hypothetical protein